MRKVSKYPFHRPEFYHIDDYDLFLTFQESLERRYLRAQRALLGESHAPHCYFGDPEFDIEQAMIAFVFGICDPPNFSRPPATDDEGRPLDDEEDEDYYWVDDD